MTKTLDSLLSLTHAKSEAIRNALASFPRLLMAFLRYQANHIATDGN